MIFETATCGFSSGLFGAQCVVAGASAVFAVSVALGLLGLSRSGLGYLNATLGIGGIIGGFAALVLVAARPARS